MQLETLKAFSDEPGRRLLELATASVAAGAEPLALLKQLRKEVPAELARDILLQAELRRKAAAKFQRCNEMLFSDLGWQQASGERVAAYKASRYLAELPVEDWCCGIGGDAIQLARLNRTTLVDRDPVMLELARHNLAVHNITDAQFQVQDVDRRLERLGHDEVQLHIDPARRNPDLRNQNQRAVRWEFYSPGPDTLQAALAWPACIKLAPACKVPPEIAAACELEWIQDEGECKQQLLWSGNLARRLPARAATVLSRDGTAQRLVADERSVTMETIVTVGSGAEPGSVAGQDRWTSSLVAQPRSKGRDAASRLAAGNFLYRPQPAVMAAGLARELCEWWGLSWIDSRPQYFASEDEVHCSLLATFRLLRETSSQPQQLRADLRAEDCGQLECKCPEPFGELARSASKFKWKGARRLTLIATQAGGRPKFLICERLNQQHAAAG